MKPIECSVLCRGTVYYTVQDVSTFESVDEILKRDNLPVSHYIVHYALPCGAVYYVVQDRYMSNS